jgi:tRNA threonylcarbamoyladenosine biosynthesis protein TsaB
MNAMLAIETSVAQASVVLWLDGGVVFGEEFTTDRSHNSMIFDPLNRALALLGDRKLELVITGTGPGSYSGTRVGIAAGQGIAIAHGCPSVGLGSLAATPDARADGVSMAVGDARRGLYFVSPINAAGEAMEAELMAAEPFQQRLSSEPETRLFSLDDPDRLGLSGELRQRVTQSRPEAKWLIDIWLGLSDARREELIQKPLAPAYLRPPFTSKAKARHPLLR